jgi:hypothetical protein
MPTFKMPRIGSTPVAMQLHVLGLVAPWLRMHCWLAVQVEASGNSSGSPYGKDMADDASCGTSDEVQWGAGLRDAEMLVWMGDFNYRWAEWAEAAGWAREAQCLLLLGHEPW